MNGLMNKIKMQLDLLYKRLFRSILNHLKLYWLLQNLKKLIKIMKMQDYNWQMRDNNHKIIIKYGHIQLN